MLPVFMLGTQGVEGEKFKQVELFQRITFYLITL